MKRLALFAAAIAAIALPFALSAQSSPPDQPADFETQVRRIAQQLHPVDGEVPVPGANAVLHLGEDYYFLPAAEARLVLTEGWGNPPEATEGVLGMVFPAGKTFADDTWGAVITYEDTGYVSDDDAQSIDYEALLAEMRSSEAAINEESRRQGYPTQQLIGWAQAPVYDARRHSLVWARNIRFEGAPENTLNYDIRLLGRRGVLSLNMVTTLSKLADTRRAAERFAAAAEFRTGERYADFDPSSDRVAEYGIAGLIAAGAGAAAAKKVGLLALILGFGKKIVVFLIAGVAMLATAARRLFRRKEEEPEVSYASAFDQAGADEPAPEVETAETAASEAEPPEPAPERAG